MSKKPKVWFVDDLQSNLDAFTQAHDQYFEVTTFLEPTAVLDRLGRDRPDALLCDVFFYDTPEEAQDIEDRVSKEVEALRQTAIEIGALEDRFLVGITLMEEIAVKYKNSVPFPIYAYTSKGPYLLAEGAWDRILSVGARVLLKNRYGRAAERILIQGHIDISKMENSVRGKLTKRLYSSLISTGILTAALAIVVDRFLIS